jgi:Transglycosylase-like domain
MRIRIALTTAVAVIAFLAVLFSVFSSTPARVTHHKALGQRRAEKIGLKLTSYAQAEEATKLALFYNAVKASQEATYMKEVAFYKDLTFYKDVIFYKDLAFFKAVAAHEQQQQAAAPAAAAAPAPAPASAAATSPALVPAAAAAPAPVPAPAPAGGSSDATSTNTPDWACIREHESGGNYAEPGGGAYQFELGTWQSLTGLPSPAEDYPPSVQDAAALELYAQRGWEPWTTRYVCGL